MQELKYFDSFNKRINHRLFFQLSTLVVLGIAILFVKQTSAQTQDGINDKSNPQSSSIYKIEDTQNYPIPDLPVTKNVTSGNTPTPTPSNACIPATTVREGNLFTGGVISFDVLSEPGSVTVAHVSTGTGLQTLTVVGKPTNAIVNIPAFSPGTFDKVVVTFTPIVPGLAVDFTLRAASTFHAANISVRCAETCTPITTVTEGDLLPGGIISFNVWSGPGTVTIDYIDSGLGLKGVMVMGVPINAVVSIPQFESGTHDPVVLSFTPIDPNQPVDFRLRAASREYAVFIRVRCLVQNKRN